MACEPWESDVDGVEMFLTAVEVLTDSIDDRHYSIELARVNHHKRSEMIPVSTDNSDVLQSIADNMHDGN